MHFRDQEAEGAEHHECEPNRGVPREEAEEQAEAARGFRDGQEAQRVEHTGGHLRGRLSLPQTLLVCTVDDEN